MIALVRLVLAAQLLAPQASAPQAVTAHAHEGAMTPNDGQAVLDSLADETASRLPRFADRRAAIAAGYRRIGTDFPSMGEHWLHPGALLAQRIDPDRPTILAYADIEGTPTLLGAGYVITTRGDAAARAPGWPTYWHEHSGLLSDESGAHVGAAQESDSATHVWVLHVWTALPNPLGRYDSDNWALPFARAGITAPATIDADIGRVFSLAVAGGDEYLRRVLTDAGLRTGDALPRDRAIDGAIEAAREVAVAVAARAGGAGVLSARGSSELRDAWDELARQLRAAAGPAIEQFLVPPHAHHGDARPERADGVAARALDASRRTPTSWSAGVTPTAR
jgi:hypothetical protein